MTQTTKRNYRRRQQADNLLSASTEMGHLFAPSPVRNLRRLIKWTNAKIVLSSSWKMDGLETMQQMWNERNMPGEIYDITPYVMHGNTPSELEA